MKRNISTKFILIALVLIYLIVFKSFPYFNLVLQAKVIAGLIFVLVIFLFSVTAEWLWKLAIFLLGPALLLTLFHKASLGELVGEVIYLLLTLGFVKKLNDFRRLV